MALAMSRAASRLTSGHTVAKISLPMSRPVEGAMFSSSIIANIAVCAAKSCLAASV